MTVFSEFFVFVVIVIGVVCGGFSASIATAKGRNALAWFVCGFAINLAGILFALLAEPNHDQMVRDRQRKRCPFCAEAINVEALKCPHCTADLPDIAELPDSSAREKEQTSILNKAMKPCPLCGQLIPSKSTFCPHCNRDCLPRNYQINSHKKPHRNPTSPRNVSPVVIPSRYSQHASALTCPRLGLQTEHGTHLEKRTQSKSVGTDRLSERQGYSFGFVLSPLLRSQKIRLTPNKTQETLFGNRQLTKTH